MKLLEAKCEAAISFNTYKKLLLYHIWNMKLLEAKCEAAICSCMIYKWLNHFRTVIKHQQLGLEGVKLLAASHSYFTC